MYKVCESGVINAYSEAVIVTIFNTGDNDDDTGVTFVTACPLYEPELTLIEPVTLTLPITSNSIAADDDKISEPVMVVFPLN